MSATTPTQVIDGRDIAAELAALVADRPGRLYAVAGERRVTVGELDAAVDRVREVLADAGIGRGARVAVALPNTVEHVVVVFALVRAGVLWVPLNPRLKGAPLAHLLHDSGATHLVAERGDDVVAAVAASRPGHEEGLGAGITVADEAGTATQLWRLGDAPGGVVPGTSLLLYTSGTTGPPKGVRVSQSMLRAAAVGALAVTDARAGDVLYVWEPIFHVGGAQTLLMPLYADVSLALARRFSASGFWGDVVRTGATHVHYLGGILQILLQRPVTALERGHRVRVAWGAGATPAIWEECRRRFGFAVHECYGMTETSSIVTVNTEGPDQGVGRPLPWFEVRAGEGNGGPGEILVRPLHPGLLTPGYLGNPEASAAARTGEWFRTGDHGTLDAAGNLHFHGRASDSIRVRGENVSAWQVEDVYGRHPDVDRCAVVGAAADVGEQEMVLLLTLRAGAEHDARSVVAWGADHLAPFQVPRYVRTLDEMPLTPSQRVAKHQLPRGLDGALDCAVAGASRASASRRA
ncbi:AMP-binding protein [Krasilnikoviella flava]|uniref:Crotonobetaine/carnitine-CoA ligase n=1 Tax=Krasilnikoviella flava TaxID=526729 RepID=A0A1T5L4H5_9MICO|nr:AMP-binding protein [Krasilnikoviella flava]SKC70834.1 crotonobetaine/carnitine-CoA ligase [Krasilnikoviella flava]